MSSIILVSLFAATAMAGQDYYSISTQVGNGGGSAFTLQGDGHITGVRVWDNGRYVYGIQLRFGDIWSARAGLSTGAPHTLELYEDEAIIQISGKWSRYINWLYISTNRGRSLIVGQPQSNSFNMYPDHPEAELVSISGTVGGPMTGFSAQWNKVFEHYENTEKM